MKTNNKGLIITIIFLIILLLGLSSYIIFDKINLEDTKKEQKTTTITTTTSPIIENIINDYDLQNIREIIYSNDEFFIEFANAIISNDKVNSHTSQVLNLFPIVIDNQSHLNKDYFLERLRTLSINKVNQLENANGIYEYINNKIEYLDGLLNEKKIIYHELLHFLDYSLNTGTFEYFYVCDNYFTTDFEKTDDDCSIYWQNYFSLFIEGGAEKNSATYFSDDIPIVSSYAAYFNFYNMLVYIFDEKTIDDIYFSRNTEYEIYKLLCVDNNYSHKDFNKMAENFISEFNFYDLADAIIDIYYLKNTTKWYEDPIFKDMVQIFLVQATNYTDSQIEGTKYEDEYKKYTDNTQVLDDLDKYSLQLSIKNPKHTTGDIITMEQFFTIINNEVYYINYYEYPKFPADAYIIKYNFEEKKIEGHTTYSFE